MGEFGICSRGSRHDETRYYLFVFFFFFTTSSSYKRDSFFCCKGCVYIRIKSVSPGNDNQKYSVLCGEQIVLPVIGSKKTYVLCSLDSLLFLFICFERNFCSIPVTYEPQSLFVKLVLFQHKLTVVEDPIATATIVFEDEKVEGKIF